MAPGMAEAGEDPRAAALDNHLILKRIFSYLPFNDLKNCRLVSKMWKFEAVSYMRDFRQCHVSISGVNLCSDLYELDELVSEMNLVPMNGLSLDLGECHSVCHILPDKSNVDGELLDKMTLKYLNIRSSMSMGRRDACPGISFVILLLRERLTELRLFKYDLCYSYCLLERLGDDWAPRLPKLTMLDVGCHWELQKDFFLKLINGAPNLKQLKGYFDKRALYDIPEEKYCLLDSFSLRVSSEEDEEKCWKLVEARPALSQLISFASYQHEFRQEFFNILEELLAISWKTLEKLEMNGLVFPLTQLNFPPMVNLKTLAISTGGAMEQLLNVLKFTDYAERLPALAEIEILQYVDYSIEELEPLQNALEDIVVPAQPNSSAGITLLKLTIDPHESVFQELSLGFPNVTELVITPPRMELRTEVPYHHLWAYWPLLESVYLTEEIKASNFDADFLGIYPEEVEILREQSDESLAKMNIVPIRPCILTMPRLRSLKIRFYERQWEDDPAVFDRDEVFLSKVTGILAFRKLTQKGVCIQLAGRYPQIFSKLTHLTPFAPVVLDDGEDYP